MGVVLQSRIAGRAAPQSGAIPDGKWVFFGKPKHYALLMMMKPTTFLLSLLALCLGVSLPLVSRAETACDDFSSPQLSAKWKAAIGEWKAVEGKLKGVEQAADKHPAVMTYQAPHTDSKVSFSFQLAGSKGFHLSFNHAKGHLFRVMVSESNVMVRTDKDKKDPASKSEVLCQKDAAFEQGKTYTITCETRGDTVSVTFDKGPELTGSHPSLATEKTGYRLVVQGEGVLFDDFKAEN